MPKAPKETSRFDLNGFGEELGGDVATLVAAAQHLGTAPWSERQSPLEENKKGTKTTRLQDIILQHIPQFRDINDI